MLRSHLLALLLACAAPVALAGANEDLLQAVLEGRNDAAVAALAAGADADTTGDQQATALMLAAERGHVAIMRTLLDAGASARAVREGGITTLMHAAASGKPEVLQMLLDAGIDVNARSTRASITALRIAAATGALDAARLLLAAGADRNEVDESGSRLLFAAASSGSVELIDLFLAPDEDVNFKRREGGYTALDVALERQHWRAAEHLMQCGATLDASVTGRENAVIKLLDLEPVVQPGKANPLVQTVELPSTALFRAVLEQGAGTGFRDDKGNTLLILAAKRHHVTALEALLEAGIDVDARNSEGDTALSIAAGKSEYELIVVGLGLALGQDRESLMKLVFRPAQKSVESPSTARRLLSAQQLLAAKADPNVMDSGGNTPLIEAIRSGDAELVDMLIAAGADVNARNGLGAAPLSFAAQFGLHEIATQLISARADLSVRDQEGRGLVDLAREGGHARMVQLLEQAALN